MLSTHPHLHFARHLIDDGDDVLSATGIDRCCRINGRLELVVLVRARAEGLQRPEPNRLLRRSLSVELARGQYIERPLLDIERVDMVAVRAVEQTEDVHGGASPRAGGIGVGNTSKFGGIDQNLINNSALTFYASFYNDYNGDLCDGSPVATVYNSSNISITNNKLHVRGFT